MKDVVVNVILDTAAVADGAALSEGETEFARRIFIAVMRRGLRRLTSDENLTDEQYLTADKIIQEWAELALSEEAKWLLN
jgi:hypothetical protein